MHNVWKNGGFTIQGKIGNGLSIVHAGKLPKYPVAPNPIFENFSNTKFKKQFLFVSFTKVYGGSSNDWEPTCPGRLEK
jgi:hypothetical protein